MVINHLEKLFVTSDASTIVTELDVNHPAAKLLVMAAKAQAAEVGDGTNLVLSLAGELLANAEGLLREGLHTAEIADGYQKALEKALEILEELVLPGSADLDVKDAAAVAARLRGAISSKVYGYEDFLSKLVAEACIDVVPENPANFNVDNVRIVKLMGGALPDSHVVKVCCAAVWCFGGLCSGGLCSGGTVWMCVFWVGRRVRCGCVWVCVFWRKEGAELARTAPADPIVRPAETTTCTTQRNQNQMQGMVFKRDTEGTIKEAADAKVVVYAQGVDTTGTETKGTVLIKSAEELEGYSR